MGKIREEDIERVRNAVDIVEVIGGYIPLKRTGRSFSASCPFHSEKTGSFHVFPESQLFKCFGCGKSGSVYSFLMAQERMEFPEAVKKLAERAGIQIKEDPIDTQRDAAKEQAYAALRDAAYGYRAQLFSQRGAEAAAYLNSRGFKKETLDKFMIGYAPGEWDYILQTLGKQFSAQALEEAGLLSKSQQGTRYDRFRDRIMFPIFDIRGRTIGFGARVMPGAPADSPKYINSPMSPVFDKSRTLYGLNFARETDLEKNGLLIVEGYTDAAILHQQGITNCAATIGTALTPEHARQIKRYTSKILLCFDPDPAGQQATMRALDSIKGLGMSLEQITLPEKKDPDTVALEEGTENFRKRMAASRPFFEFALERILQETPGQNAYDKWEAILKIAPIIRTTKDPVLQLIYCHEAQKKLGVPIKAVTLAVGKHKENELYLLLDSLVEFEWKTAAHMMQNPGYRQLFASQLTPDHFETPELKILFSYLKKKTEEAMQGSLFTTDQELQTFGLPLFAKTCAEDLPQNLMNFARQNAMGFEETGIYALASTLRTVRLPEGLPPEILIKGFKKEYILRKIKKANAENAPDEAVRLIREYNELTAEETAENETEKNHTGNGTPTDETPQDSSH